MVARIEMVGVSKAFPGVRALERVDFRVEAGEVHALMGENGAGKSTLIKIMTGAIQGDEGEIQLDGRPVHIGKTGDAQALGIGTVYQEVNLVPTMSVTKNLTLLRQPKRFGLIDWGAAQKRARERLKRLDIDIDVERPLGSYSVAIQQLVAIARALEDDTRVLVLDEPTASLDANEVGAPVQDRPGPQGSRHRHCLHHPFYRSGLRNRGPRLGAAQRPPRRLRPEIAELPPLKMISLMLGRELERTEERAARAASTAVDKPILVAEGLGRRRVMAPFDLVVARGRGHQNSADSLGPAAPRSPNSSSARSSPIPEN